MTNVNRLARTVATIAAVALIAAGCPSSRRGSNGTNGTNGGSGTTEPRVGLPTNVGDIVAGACATSCQDPDSNTCVQCLIDECSKVVGEMAEICERIHDEPQGSRESNAVAIDTECTDLSDTKCREEICSELCGDDAFCSSACVQQLSGQTGEDDELSIRIICVEECNDGDDEACHACIQTACEVVCGSLSISEADKAHCRAGCGILDESTESGGVCGGESIAAPVGVTIGDSAYGGNGCPVGLEEQVDLVLVDRATAVELRLPENTAPITADATGKSFSRAYCGLTWVFANVPADVCWSIGNTAQDGVADVGGGYATFAVRSEFTSSGVRNETEGRLSVSGAFTAALDENDAGCSENGGDGIQRFSTSVTATRGSKISIEHAQRIPIRWFSCQ